jgi:outer membrane protein OmpA-like peptidoglycan-associated protein
MADNELTAEELEHQRLRRRAAMATPVADEGDVAFGAMAGIAVLAAIMAAMFAFFGFATAAPIEGGGEPEVPEVSEPDEPDEVVGVDLGAMLGILQAEGFGGLELVADGGVVTARGEVADEAARAELLRLIAAQPNVEEVIDRLTIAVPEVGAAAATIAANDDAIILSGTVPSEAAAEVLRSFAAVNYGPDQITDDLVVQEGADPATVSLSGSISNSELGSSIQSGFAGLAGFTGAIDALVIEADASEEINAVFELEPILFQSGTAIILPESQSTIEAAIEILSRFPDAEIEIGGHTDSLGPDEANRILSESRAQAVLQALRDGGVSNQLVAVGYGESQLKFPDDKGETQDKIDARQANRRIEFKTL